MPALVHWTEDPRLRRWACSKDCPLKSPPPAFGSAEREEVVARKKRAIARRKKLSLSPTDGYHACKVQLEMRKIDAILAPIRNTPFEILSQIFLFLGPFHCPEREHARKLVALMLACKIWHHCIIETPEIWSEVRLEPSSWSFRHQKVFDAWLPRARRHPLRIQVDHSVTYRTFIFTGAVQTIESRSTQIDSMDLRLDRILPTDLERTFEFVGKCINLTSLKFSLRSFPSINSLQLSLPRLRHLALPRNNMGVSCLSPQLEELIFTEVEGSGLLDYLNSLSVSYPDLRSLTIGSVYGSNNANASTSTRDSTKLSFSELRYLRCGNIPVKALHHLIQCSPMLDDLNAHITFFTVLLPVPTSIAALTITSPLDYPGLRTNLALEVLAKMTHLKTLTLPAYSFLRGHPSNDPEAEDATMSILATLTSRMQDGRFVCPGLEGLKCFSPIKAPSRRFLDNLSQIEKERSASERNGSIELGVGNADTIEVQPRLTVQVLWSVSTKSIATESIHQATLEDVKEALKDYPNLKGLLV